MFSIAAGSVVALEGLVITGGSAPDPSTGSGGGIANDGTATITDCTFSGNSAGFVGGGLYNSGLATATVSDCDFEGNTSTYGAGFNNQGAATVTGGSSATIRPAVTVADWTISARYPSTGRSSRYSAASYGGAVNVYGGFVGSPGTTLLQGCTFRNNTSNYVAGVGSRSARQQGPSLTASSRATRRSSAAASQTAAQPQSPAEHSATTRPAGMAPESSRLAP